MKDIVTQTPIVAGVISPDGEIDVQRLLEEWKIATKRLEATHATLRDEVRRLTDELEIKNRDLARKNRLADLGQMASHIAHEVRNGLMPITLYMSLLRRRVSDDAGCLDIVDKIDSGFTALDTTVNDLLHFTAERDAMRSRFDIHSLLNEIVVAFTPQFDAQAIRVEMEATPSTEISADREMVRRAVMNLVLNAIDVMPEGGYLVITVCSSPQLCEIEVADSGPGLSAEVSKHLFEPFYTTKGTGTGLGLSIVERIAAAHGGSIGVQNCAEGGAAFTLTIPQHAMEAAA
jgi:signal transduction histidine kinase